MRRARIAPVLLALLAVPALVVPAKAIAGPPEGVSGKMAFDEVADGLRKYRKEKDEGKRSRWLSQLALTGDPRVAVTLGALMVDEKVGDDAENTLGIFFAFPGRCAFSNLEVKWWWQRNEADLRRRAKQLPQ